MKGWSAGDLRRALARHRVLLAAGLAAGSVAAGLSAVVPAQEAGVPVLIATRDLGSGAELGPDDLRTTSLPGAAVPEGALTDPAGVIGRVVAGPVRRGETLTDVRLLGSGLLDGDDDAVAAPVRVAEPATAALVRAGDRVDILSAAPEGGAAASVVAEGVRVLSVPFVDDAVEGALIVVAATRSTAVRLAAAAVTGRLSLVVLPR